MYKVYSLLRIWKTSFSISIINAKTYIYCTYFGQLLNYFIFLIYICVCVGQSIKQAIRLHIIVISNANVK